MSQITSEHTTFLLQTVWLPAYASEHPITKGVISAIPADKATNTPRW
jgi:hypothetical protein